MVTSRATAAPTNTQRRTLGFVAAVFVFAVVMMGTTIPTPLYPSYEARFGFGSTTTTVLFAVYAAGVIGALVLVGRLSDAVGRRPMLLAGIVLSFVSAVLFVVGVPEGLLYAGRVLSGLSAGILTATGTVTVIEAAPAGRDRTAGALATAANIGGLGLGMLMGGLVGAWTPWTLRAPFVVHAVLLMIAGIALLAMRETAGRADGDRARFRLQMPRIPSESRRVFWASSVGAITGFAVCGLFSSVAPNFVGSVLGIHSPAVVGTVTFLLFAASAAAQIVLARLPDRTEIVVGTIALVVGMLLLVWALLAASLLVLVVSAIAAGIGQGLLFMTGMRAITGRTDQSHRTEATTAYFITAYLSISIPSIAAGILAGAVGLTPAGVGFAVAVAVLALAGLGGLGAFSGRR